MTPHTIAATSQMTHRTATHRTATHRDLRPGALTSTTLSDRADRADHDGGWTLIEILLVVLIIGILATAVVFAISGMRAEAAGSSCDMDHRNLATATESYFAEHHSSDVPATGTDHDRFEQTLVDGGFLRDVSNHHDLDATGAVIPEGNSPC